MSALTDAERGDLRSAIQHVSSVCESWECVTCTAMFATVEALITARVEAFRAAAVAVLEVVVADMEWPGDFPPLDDEEAIEKDIRDADASTVREAITHIANLPAPQDAS